MTPTRLVTLLPFLALTACGNDATRWTDEVGWGATGAPAVGPDGTLYVGARGAFSGVGWVRAYTPDGDLEWEAEGGDPIVGADGLLYAVSGPLLLAIAPKTGEIRWHAEAGGEIAVRQDGWVFSTWRTTDDDRLGQSHIAGVAPTGELRWEHTVFGEVVQAPLITAKGTVVFLAADEAGANSVLAYDRDGQALWTSALAAPPAGGAIGRDGDIYIAGEGYLSALPDDPTTAGWRLDLASASGSPVLLGPPIFGRDGHIYASADVGLVSIAVGAAPAVRWTLPGMGGGLAAGDDGRIYVTHGSTLAVVSASGAVESVTDMYTITHTTGAPALANGYAYVAGFFFHNQTYYGPDSELLGVEQAHQGFIHGHPVDADGPAGGWSRSPGGDNGNTRAAVIPKGALGPPAPALGPETAFGEWRAGFGVEYALTGVTPLPDGGYVTAGGGSVITAAPTDLAHDAWVRVSPDRARLWLAVVGADGSTRAMTALDVAGTETTDHGYQDPDTSFVDQVTVLSDGTIVALGRVASDDSGAQHALAAFHPDLTRSWTLDLPVQDDARYVRAAVTDAGDLVLLAERTPEGSYGREVSVVRVPMSGGAPGQPTTQVLNEGATPRILQHGVDGQGRVLVVAQLTEEASLLGDTFAPAEPPQEDVLFALVDGAGVVWTRQFAGVPDVAAGAVAGPDGSWTLGGALYRSINFGHGVLEAGDTTAGWPGWVLHLGADGTPEWSYEVGADDGRGVTALAVDRFGNVTAAGPLGKELTVAGQPLSTRGASFIAVQLNADGALLAAIPTYAGTFTPSAAFAEEDGGITLAGWGAAPVVGFGAGAVDMRQEAWVKASSNAPFTASYVVRLTGAGALGPDLEVEPPPITGERLEVDVDGPGRVVSSPAGIDCPGTCEADFEALSEVTLTAVPDADGHLVRWTEGPCDAGLSCVFILREPTAVTARFMTPGVRWITPVAVGGRPTGAAGVSAGYVLLHELDGGATYAIPGGDVTPPTADVALVSYDGAGAATGARVITSPAQLRGGALAPASDGGFVFAGVVYGADAVDLGAGALDAVTASDLVVARYAAGGSVAWTRRYGIQINGALRLAVASDGGLVVAGAECWGGTFGDVTVPAEAAGWVAAIGSDGAPRWLRRVLYGGVNDVAALPGGAAAAVSNAWGVDLGRGQELAQESTFLARYDGSGALVRVTTIPHGSAQEGRPLVAATSGGVLFAMPTNTYGAAPDGTSLDGLYGVLGVWGDDGALSGLRAIAAATDFRPVALVAGPDGAAVGGSATGPYGDALGTKPRYDGAALTTVTAGGAAGWFLPTWEDDVPEEAFPPTVEALFRFPGGELGALLATSSGAIFAGHALAPGDHVARLSP